MLVSIFFTTFLLISAELGDYADEEHKPGYASQYRYVPNQTEQFEAKVESLHRRHQGQTPADAELNYLDEAKILNYTASICTKPRYE